MKKARSLFLFLPIRTGVLRDDPKERLRNRLARPLLYCLCSKLIFFPVCHRSLSQKQCRVFPFGRSMLSQVRGPVWYQYRAVISRIPFTETVSALSLLKKNWEHLNSSEILVFYSSWSLPAVRLCFWLLFGNNTRKKMGDHDFIPRSFKKTVFKHKDDKNIFSAGNMIQGWLPGECVCHTVSQNKTLIIRKVTRLLKP